ncbi:MAG: alpha/beta fold hydrolase [Pseudomonadota bacterium]
MKSKPMPKTRYPRLRRWVAFLMGLTAISISHHAKPEVALDLERVDERLARTESQYTDIVEGSEKQVRWANAKVKSEYALVYLHGFSASRREISPVTENLADLLNANVYYPRLRGHARGGAAMAEGNVDDWKKDTLEALDVASQIGEKIVFISTSTGGTLATWLMALLTETQDPRLNKIERSILVSPNFGLANASGEIMRWGWGLQLAKWLRGDEHFFVPQNELHSLYWTERYPLEAIVPMVHLLDEVNELDLSAVSVPQHFVYAPEDQVIDVSAINEIASKYKSASTSMNEITNATDPAQHVIAGDACSPETTDELVALMQEMITASSTLTNTDSSASAAN